MNKIVIIMFFISSLFGCKAQTETSTIKVLDVAEYKEAISSPNIQLIDVRTPNEYEKGHIENAKLIDFFAKGFKEKLQELDKEKTIYLYCRSGGRSAKASKILKELGFKEIIDLKGGFLAWSKN